jgi:hypothetical protein
VLLEELAPAELLVWLDELLEPGLELVEGRLE